jgi:hypothetical protein
MYFLVLPTGQGYKPEGRGFETRWGEILNLSGRIGPRGLLNLYQKWVLETLGKKNFWARQPYRLTTL